MNSIRSGPRLATFGDKVVAVGDCDDQYEFLDSTEVYDIEKDSWTAGPTLNNKRLLAIHKFKFNYVLLLNFE